jgi:hypothetical protein
MADPSGSRPTARRPTVSERAQSGRRRAPFRRGERAGRSEDAAVNAARASKSRSSPWLLVAVLIYAPVILFVDGKLAAAWPWEYVLGALTLAALALWTTRLSATDRVQVWVCVVVATGWEYLGSQIWGGYRYRFGGIPAFVPFGHGLVYVFAFTLAATPWVRRHERPFTYGILALAWAWALAGITALPALTGRVDFHGLFWLPLFTGAILLSPRKALFAGIFIAVTDLELAGTWFGAWTWLPNTPWAHVTSGNPPSAIAGGYTVIDGSVLLLVALLASLKPASRRPVSESAVTTGARTSRMPAYDTSSTANSANPT